MKDRIKLCPFCGSEAEVINLDPFHRKDKAFWVFGVKCKDCGIAVWKCSEEEAVEAWNRRAKNGT
ncbi:MAG: Lar family restriction alleviation protein [Clostridia bacterium]|nr:Lar family restriction alleviation protein [Clostridia bacterium]